MTTDRFGTLLGHSNALGIGEKGRPEDFAAIWSESAKRLGGGAGGARVHGRGRGASAASRSATRSGLTPGGSIAEQAVAPIPAPVQEQMVAAKAARPVRSIRDLAPRPEAAVVVAPRKRSAVMAVVEWLTAGMRPRKGGNGPDRAALVGVKPMRNTLELADLEVGPVGNGGRRGESSGSRVFKASRTISLSGSCAGSQRL